MQNLMAICMCFVATGLVLSMFLPGPRPSSSSIPEGDPSDLANQRRLGFLMGFVAGLPDAVVARYALSRVEESQRSKVTVREIGFAIGFVMSWAW